jgi:hypothetical protein
MRIDGRFALEQMRCPAVAFSHSISNSRITNASSGFVPVSFSAR